MRGGLLAGGMLLASAAACSGTGPLDALRFACRSSNECVAPYVCQEGECTPPLQGGPGADAGGDAGDAGTCPGSPGSELCSDGRDDDCDGLTDCADPDCSAQPCADEGWACSGGVCACGGNGGVPEPTEGVCSDGLDNDCDGLRDCEDPDCAQQQCSQANPAGACCGAACVDLSTSEAHCGSCGNACQLGQTCQPEQQGTLPAGRCS